MSFSEAKFPAHKRATEPRMTHQLDCCWLSQQHGRKPQHPTPPLKKKEKKCLLQMTLNGWTVKYNISRQQFLIV